MSDGILRPWPKPQRKAKVPKPLKKYNAKRKGRAFGAACVDDDYLDWLRKFACAICSVLQIRQESPTEAEHWVKKSAGGKDHGETFPTCAHHRELRHGAPREFEKLLRKYKINPVRLCKWYATQYDKERYPCP